VGVATTSASNDRLTGCSWTWEAWAQVLLAIQSVGAMRQGGLLAVASSRGAPPRCVPRWIDEVHGRATIGVGRTVTGVPWPGLPGAGGGNQGVIGVRTAGDSGALDGPSSSLCKLGRPRRIQAVVPLLQARG
jgi:hypothetical protein